jgi:CubicO group peptidase (beta-lactamase class C family)
MKTTFIKFCFALLLFVAVFSCTKAPKNQPLPRSVPEAEGVSSESIITFLDSAATNRSTEFHSFMFIRHGKVIAEGWWNPFKPELKHTLYSTSKSFTSTAVGLAIKEEKLHLDDKVISFFPDLLPDTISQFLVDLEIKDLLSMSTGQRRESANTGIEWVKSFLATPVESEPGTKYRYSSMASYMLSAIVQKVSGEKVIDFLTPRLFEPLGIEGADWETSPEGINTGGWGLRLKTEDLAKLGLLYLQKGNWNGKQILDPKWVEEATSLKIYQNPNLTEAQRDSVNDSMQGYCYQFWRAKNNSYMANGAYGQFILVMPDKDAIVILTAESQDMWGELAMVWKYLYPGIKDNPLPANEKTVSELRNRLAELTIPAPEKNINEEKSVQISGKTIDFSENPRSIKNMTVRFEDNLCKLNIATDTSAYDLSFGSGEWFLEETTLHGPNLFARTANNQNGLPPFKTAGAWTWKDDQSLELTLRYIDCMHTLRLVFNFEQPEKVLVDFLESNSPERKATALEGHFR